MTLRQLFIRFTLVYFGAIVVLATAAVWLDFKSSAINTAALGGAVVYVCVRFAEKNGRRFTEAESSAVWKGLLAIDMALQLSVFGLMSAAGQAPSMLSGPVLFAMGFVTLLHAAMILLLVRKSGSLYEKQQAALARKAEKKAQKLAAKLTPLRTVPPPPDRSTPPQGATFSDTVPLGLR